MRYSTDPAEKIRKSKNLTEEEFSISIGLSWRSYTAALTRGYLTRRMVRDISLTHHVKMAEFQPVDGG